MLSVVNAVGVSSVPKTPGLCFLFNYGKGKNPGSNSLEFVNEEAPEGFPPRGISIINFINFLLHL